MDYLNMRFLEELWSVLDQADWLCKVDPDLNAVLTTARSSRKSQDIVSYAHASRASGFLYPENIELERFHLLSEILQFSSEALRTSEERSNIESG